MQILKPIIFIAIVYVLMTAMIVGMIVLFLPEKPIKITDPEEIRKIMKAYEANGTLPVTPIQDRFWDSLPTNLDGKG